jgi:hypothetical protein
MVASTYGSVWFTFVSFFFSIKPGVGGGVEGGVYSKFFSHEGQEELFLL